MKRKGMNPALARMTQMTRESKLIDATEKANMIVSLMVLCDKFDFTPEQVEKYMSEFRKQLDAYRDGYVKSVKDFTDVLKDEYGIVI